MADGSRPGGRSSRVRAAVLSAVVAEVQRAGFAGLSMERIAGRAGVNKTTLYRRWGSRAELISDLVAELAAREIPVPDTGSLMEDLRALMHGVVTALASLEGAALVRGVVLEAEHADDLREAAARFWSERFAGAAAVVRRGMRRGEVSADCDVDLLVERLVAPMYLRRFVTQQPVDRAYADRVLAATMGPIT
ncbi:MAG TPA: TetR/AcrR family transcriptional regulator [Nocardioidaceae bacterium]|nr:TetR/AcrR family transcriptional regulator [Nocardioidaceae bacterium]